MVTTTVGMLNGVHRNTSDLGPAVSLVLVLVVRTSGLQERLVETSTSGDDTDHSTAVPRDGLLGSRGHSDLRFLGVIVVRDNGRRVSGALGETSAVSGLLLDVADNGTLGHILQRKNVSDGKLRLGSAINELSSVHSFGSDEKMLVELEPVGVLEDDLGERSSSTGLVDDLLHHSLDVTVLLGEIKVSHFDSSFSELGVGFENRSRTLSLSCYLRKE